MTGCILLTLILEHRPQSQIDGFKLSLYYLLALSFLICRMGTVTLSIPQGCCEDLDGSGSPVKAGAVFYSLFLKQYVAVVGDTLT